MRKFLSFAILAVSVLLNACDDTKHLETTIRSEVIKEAPAVASLEAIYVITFLHFEENWVTSDDLFIQKDAVNIDYGFPIEEGSIRVVNENGRKILQVRLGKGEVLAVNRLSVNQPEVTHKGYRPKDKDGKLIDIDQHMNSELEKLKQTYGERNLKHARENIKNFFKLIAAKYGLELDFQ